MASACAVDAIPKAETASTAVRMLKPLTRVPILLPPVFLGVQSEVAYVGLSPGPVSHDWNILHHRPWF